MFYDNSDKETGKSSILKIRKEFKIAINSFESEQKCKKIIESVHFTDKNGINGQTTMEN